MKKVLVLVGLLLCVGTVLHADLYIKSKMHMDAIAVMGQNRPASDTVLEQWMGPDAFASVAGDTTTLIDFKANKLYIINNAAKTYVEAALPLDMVKLLPPEAAQMAGMMKATVTVMPNGQTKTVGAWPCQGYDVTIAMMMMKISIVMWATKSLGAEMKPYMDRAYTTLLKTQNAFFDDAALKEYQKIDGFPVASETTMDMMGQAIKSTMEVVEVSKKAAPAGVYTLPAGYKKNDTLSMQDLQKR